jgi:hypothetical protein
MAGGVERDNQEPHPRQPAEQPHVRATAEAESVQKDQRDTVTADGHTDLVAVVECHHMVGQPDAGSRGLVGYRCLTHMNIVNQAKERMPLHPLCASLRPA